MGNREGLPLTLEARASTFRLRVGVQAQTLGSVGRVCVELRFSLTLFHGERGIGPSGPRGHIASASSPNVGLGLPP
jgi:hypothetical protein